MARRQPIHVITFVLLSLSSAQPIQLSSAEQRSNEVPESIHRRSWLPFPQERLMQRMLLEATLKHRSPIKHTCSSLEGTACLYGSRAQPVVARDLLAEETGEAVAEAAQRKVKLIMLRPNGGTDMKVAIKKYLNQMQERSNEAKSGKSGVHNSQGDTSPEDNGEVIYEGTSEGLADLEGLAQQMVRASGLPQSAAAALQVQLVRAITNVEFDKEDQLKDAPPAGSIGLPASSSPDDQSKAAAGSDSASSVAHGSDGGTEPSKLSAAGSNLLSSLPPEAIEGMSREQLASSLKNLLEAVRISQQGKLPKESSPILGNGDYHSHDSHHHHQQQQQQQQQQADTGKRQVPQQRQPLHYSSSKQRNQESASAASLGHTGEATQPEDDVTSRSRTYVDDEGRQFLLDGSQQDSGDQVWYDTQTGSTYTAEDGKGTSGRLTRRLGNDRAWLDGLNDAEYDAYWDAYYDDLDGEAQTDLNSDQPSRRKAGSLHGRQRRA